MPSSASAATARRPRSATKRSWCSAATAAGTGLLEVLRTNLSAATHLLLPVEVLLNAWVIAYRPPGIGRGPLLPLIGRLVALKNIPLPVGIYIIATGPRNATGSSGLSARPSALTD